MIEKTHSQWYAFDGLNVNYLLNQYRKYIENPNSVEESLVPIFKVWDGLDGISHPESVDESSRTISESDQVHLAEISVRVFQYINNIRNNGHLLADCYPIRKRDPQPFLELEYYNLVKSDLADMPASIVGGEKSETINDYIEKITDLYTGTIGFDVAHLPEEEKTWFYEQIENDFISTEKAQLDRQSIIQQIFKAEGLEQYLQKYYMGQKRFSGEGLETLIPVMNRIIELAALEGIESTYISMAHRARLNALVHVIDQSYEWLLAKFEGITYEEEGEPSYYDLYNSTGDVKYHLGGTTERQYGDNKITLTMANNPSHLEFVNAVIQGMARAQQDDRTQAGYSGTDFNRALPILIHGDAAMVGQGVNYETFNLSNLNAYTTGGSIHIIANNLIGFTTYNEEQLSTRYSSDPAKGFGVPVLHLNADDPESAVAATKLAFLYRQRFNKDLVINLIGYRRLGHNELDEPRMTNPVMYQAIDARGTITEVYSEYLTHHELATSDELDQVKKDIEAEFDQARQNVKDFAKEAPELKMLSEMIEDKVVDFPKVDTTVSAETLQRLNNELLTWNENFNIINNLSRTLDRRRDVFTDGKLIDWSLSEALAFATILEEGVPIRISGEDAERGTFSHRNMVMKDTVTGDNFIPMHHISNSNVSFDIYNSSLSEMAVLGYEYGYSMTAMDTLVFWEAQYGDFANGAQVMNDQFVSGGRKKWGELSGLVQLLPHGYEGAGPEHSSGRIERYLQLSAENNWTVVNLSNAAQLFHLLRRQAKLLGTEAIRPLVIFTPKSLLRSEEAASPIEDFTQGHFKSIIHTVRDEEKNDKVTKLLLSTGRINADLRRELPNSAEHIAHASIEELYPFPKDALAELIESYPHLEEIVWVQEEPMNMGAYAHVFMNTVPLIERDIAFNYVGRPAMASPAEGLPAVHKAEQKRIIATAFEQ